MLDALRRLAPALLRHLLAYGDLLYDESVSALQQWRRRVIGLAVTLFAALMALALGCVWAIAAAWDGPHRMTVIAGLCLGFLLIALLAGLYVIADAPAGVRPFSRLHAEWHEDRKMLASLDPKWFPYESARDVPTDTATTAADAGGSARKPNSGESQEQPGRR